MDKPFPVEIMRLLEDAPRITWTKPDGRQNTYICIHEGPTDYSGLDQPDERQLLCRMQRYGGTFAAHLATAWQFADPHNAAILRECFGAMLARYASAPAVED